MTKYSVNRKKTVIITSLNTVKFRGITSAYFSSFDDMPLDKPKNFWEEGWARMAVVTKKWVIYFTISCRLWRKRLEILNNKYSSQSSKDYLTKIKHQLIYLSQYNIRYEMSDRGSVTSRGKPRSHRVWDPLSLLFIGLRQESQLITRLIAVSILQCMDIYLQSPDFFICGC